jgi:hypothetical protein
MFYFRPEKLRNPEQKAKDKSGGAKREGMMQKS